MRGPSNGSGHRRSIVALDGAARVPQRFAIDWVKLGPDGRFFGADSTRNSDWHGYGDSVVAVAAGEVVLVQDGIQENTPLSSRMAVEIDETSATGNTVVVQLGTELFAVYAHLRPGSIAVTKGQKVSAGELLGQLGNSGNSLGPHLHFHLSTAVAPLAGEGRPFDLEEFRLVGRIESLQSAIRGAPWRVDPARPGRSVSGEIPLENMVVELPTLPGS